MGAPRDEGRGASHYPQASVTSIPALTDNGIRLLLHYNSATHKKMINR